MTTGGAGPLVPTFHGFVHNSMDGLILFEACLSGKLHHVPRRPHDRERSALIKSGSIFIYEENASGIKRWTDGVAWSPSRILGNFLIYRELEKPFPPGEKKRAMKRKRTSPGEPYPRRNSEQQQAPQPQPHHETTDVAHHPLTPPTPSVNGESKTGIPSNDQEKELERSLIGSLIDSYGFRSDGLVKKTMSISINGISHHMVSYYKVEDVKNDLLPRPLSDPRLQGITVRPELYMKQNFRAPVEENEQFAVDNQMHAHPQMMYPGMNGAYNMRPGHYFNGQQYGNMYNMPASSGASMYAGATSTSWPSTPSSTAMAYGSQPPYAAHGYSNPYYKDAPQSATSVKSEEQQHPSTPSINGYGQPYPPAQYQSVQRDSSHATNGMIHSNYPTPVQQQPSTFHSMSAPSGRPPYSTGQQPHHMYSTSQSSQQHLANGQYAVRSPPTQQYGMHSASASATAQSPHSHVKSPSTGSHGPSAMHSLPQDHMHSQQISYHRSNSYGVPQTPQATGHSAADINGLGISSNGSYSQPYGSAGQAFRPVVEAGGAQSGQHYGP